MHAFKKSRHFKEYTDPESGIVSYIFDAPSIPLSQSFYFTNPSATSDGRYIWMYCAFPPAASAAFGRTLGVVDLENDTFTHFPETMFLDASPAVDTETGDVYFCSYTGVYRRSPDPRKRLERVCGLPEELRGKGYVFNLATHLSFSPDKKKLFLDAKVGIGFIFGDIEIESGKYTLWRRFDRCKNHAMFHPERDDLILFAEDEYADIATGEFYKISRDGNGKLKRLWLMEKGGEPVNIPPLYTEARHEWWSADGKSIYYVDWDYGTIRYDLETKKHTVVDPRGTWHAHSSADSRYFVADENEIDGKKWYRGCPSRVHFYNTETKRYVNIVTENPALFTREEPSRYHIDPHPQFVMNDTAVMYTSTVLGKVSLAVTDVAQLLRATT